ncbi:MAG: hypothetical protein RJA24_1503 [Pseudomonadota bacterium]|jgi:hypothetical protein
MRLLFLLLLVANLGFFVYHHFLGEPADAAAQIAALQVNPEKIRMVAADRSAVAAASPVAAPPAACVEWGAFSGPDVARADGALAALALPADVLQRRVADIDGYWVHMPVMKTKAEVDRKLAELKGLGVADFYVVQDAGPWRNAVSLGLFKSEEAASAELERLRQRGVRSAIITRREKFLKQVSYFVREPSAATIARITELQRDFPAAELKAVTCPAATPTKS